MPITGLYAGLLALVGLVLWLRVSGLRMQARISIGDGGNLALADRIRRHGNFAEHVPLALILVGILERDDARPLLLHALGATLVAAPARPALYPSTSSQIEPLHAPPPRAGAGGRRKVFPAA